MSINVISVKRHPLSRTTVGEATYQIRFKEEAQQNKWESGEVVLSAIMPAYPDFSRPDAKDKYMVVNVIAADNEKVYSKLLKKLKKASEKSSVPIILSERRTLLTWLEGPSENETRKRILREAGFEKSNTILYIPESEGAIVTSFEPGKELSDIDYGPWEYVPSKQIHSSIDV